MEKQPIYNYDQEGDILYISFSPGEKAKTAVSLTDDILLRFNRSEKRAIGITILNYSYHINILQPLSYVHLDGLNDLEPDWQKDVIETLKKPPANYEVEFIPVGPSICFKHLDSVLISNISQRLAA